MSKRVNLAIAWTCIVTGIANIPYQAIMAHGPGIAAIGYGASAIAILAGLNLMRITRGRPS